VSGDQGLVVAVRQPGCELGVELFQLATELGRVRLEGACRLGVEITELRSHLVGDVRQAQGIEPEVRIGTVLPLGLARVGGPIRREVESSELTDVERSPAGLTAHSVVDRR
jgi:hypothetical protein